MTLNDIEWPFYVKFWFCAGMSRALSRGCSYTYGECRRTLNGNRQLRRLSCYWLIHVLRACIALLLYSALCGQVSVFIDTSSLFPVPFLWVKCSQYALRLSPVTSSVAFALVALALLFRSDWCSLFILYTISAISLHVGRKSRILIT